jgi:L-histidine N-alpha-methyltransferase
VGVADREPPDLGRMVTIDRQLDPASARAALELDTRTGLMAEAKWLPPIWFYDDRGSALFELITRLDEYYPTRAERAILEAHAKEIVALAGSDTLVELGSGTSEKTRLLLDALCHADRLRRFVALEVSEGTLRAAARSIAEAYGVPVDGVVGDFTRHLPHLPTGGRRLVAFLGSTIGNLEPAPRARFLFDVDASLVTGDAFLLGTDLVKDPARLVAAYDDAQGVTAAFNRNVLHRLNRELGADFDPDAFDHVAVWNGDEAWIEMRLRATRAMTVRLPALGLEVDFEDGEELRTEISAKFTPEQVAAELWQAGLVVQGTWTDPAGDFLLTLATPYC